MANIQFSSEGAATLFKEMRQKTKHLGEHSLDACILNLLSWNPWDATIHIGRDFDELSFTFRETYADGRKGICGGILYHGPRDGFGSGNGPTYGVTLEPTNGYSIHT